MSELLCKVLFIDLDDTIWDFKANSVLSLRQVYDEFALKKEIPDYDRFKSLYMATNHELWELYHHNRITKDYLIVERFSRPLRHAGSKMSEDKERSLPRCIVPAEDIGSGSGRIVGLSYGKRLSLVYIEQRFCRGSIP